VNTTTVDHIDLESSHTPEPTTPARPRWPLAGALGGAAAFASSFVVLGHDLDEAQWSMGVDVIDHLERGRYHVGFLLGLVSTVALFVAAAGWRRWAQRHAPENLAAGLVATGLIATATISVIAYALMGSMALYLPGGMDEGWLSRDAIFVNFTYLDFGSLFGWWTSVIAAGAVAVLAFGRSRLLPRWMGALSIVLPLPAVLLAAGTALPGFPGLTMPIWLVVISLGMVFSRTARA
jgi:hypothetical protein